MSRRFVLHASAVLIVVLTTTACGATFEEVRPPRPDPWSAPSRQAPARTELPASPEWWSTLDSLDESTIAVVPNAPRGTLVPQVTPREFQEFMREALRDIDLERLRAELLPPSSPLRLASVLQVPKREADITNGYLEWCHYTGGPESCLDLPPDRPYLTDFQKYRVALQAGLSHFVNGFYNELGAEIRAVLSRETFVMMIAGAMVSYMALLATPDPIFTKALAAAATVVLVAELGARTVCDLVFGFRDLIRQVDAAATFQELATAGARYAEKLGEATARLLVMAVTTLFSRGGGIAKLLKFPKLPQAAAALLVESEGVLKLKALGQVVGVRVLKGGLYVAMATAGGKDALGTSPAAPAEAPVPKSQVTLPDGVLGYKSFDAFKAAEGSAGKGFVWHHIVEKCREDIFGPAAVHNRWNIIRLDEETHLKVSRYYSSIPKAVLTDGKVVRQWLKTQSYAAQREFGLQVLRDLGIQTP